MVDLFIFFFGVHKEKKNTIWDGLSFIYLFMIVCGPEQTRGCPECMEERNSAETWPQPGMEQHGHSAGQHW